MPPKDLKLSVFQIEGFDEDRIWEMGQTYAAEPSNRTLHGRGDITVSAVYQIGLSLNPDNQPPRHADIVDWPEEKSKQKLFAVELADGARLRLNPSVGVATP